MGVASDITKRHNLKQTCYSSVSFELPILSSIMILEAYVWELYCRCIYWTELHNSEFWLVVSFYNGLCFKEKFP